MTELYNGTPDHPGKLNLRDRPEVLYSTTSLSPKIEMIWLDFQGSSRSSYVLSLTPLISKSRHLLTSPLWLKVHGSTSWNPSCMISRMRTEFVSWRTWRPRRLRDSRAWFSMISSFLTRVAFCFQLSGTWCCSFTPKYREDREPVEVFTHVGGVRDGGSVSAPWRWTRNKSWNNGNLVR